MSLASEQFGQPLVTSVFLDSHSSHAALTQALLELNRCQYVYNGDVKAAGATITYAVVKNLGVSCCQIWLYANDDPSRFRPVAHYSNINFDNPTQPIQVANYLDYFDGLSQHDWLVLNTSTTAASSTDSPENELLDNNHQEIFPPYLADQRKTTTALIEIPIYHQNNVVGVVCCDQQRTPRVWQAAETSFMVTVSHLMALTISHASNQQKKQALVKQRRQLGHLEIERRQAEQAWQESQRFIQGILDASTNILYVNDFATGTNYFVNGYIENILGYSPRELQYLGTHFLEKIAHVDDIEAIHQARQRLAHSNSGDIIESEYRLQHKQGGWRWMLCRETIFQWHADGTPLQLLGTGTDITVHKEKTEALKQKNQELTALAMVDALTQVANRRAFDEFLHNAWVALNQTPLTLVLCDIDYFKLYNDTYGHPQGDECLKLVAQALKKTVRRRPDLVARYGGEEFAIILPNTALEGAKHVAQNIQATIRELEIEHRLSDISDYLTVSLGIASVDSTADGSPQALITAADQGLYHAKANGRACFAIGYLADQMGNYQP